ncbi:MAG: ribosome silencing factor [Treponema sp.]|nr:ribosome silencing factor [Treponema sp.]
MDATLSADKIRIDTDSLSRALALGELLREHNGGDVMVLDLRQLNGWTDFFVIATVTSAAHLHGLQRHIKEFAAGEGIEILHHRRKAVPDDLWNLIDLGSIVIHLMTAPARAFYELERLWSAGTLIYP